MTEQPNVSLSWRVGFLHRLAQFFLFVLTRIEISGVENIPASGVTLFIMNHLHWLDPIIGVAVIERPAVMFTAEKWEHRPLIGDIIRWSQRAIFVNRGEPDRRALNEALATLRRGDVLAIAPEGTRSPTATLLPGKPGAIYLAAKSGLPIIPIGIVGTEDSVVKYRLKRLKRLDITARVGKPYTLPEMPKRGRDEWLQDQTDDMMCRIAALLPPDHRGVYADHPRLLEMLREHGSPFPEDQALLAAEDHGRRTTDHG